MKIILLIINSNNLDTNKKYSNIILRVFWTSFLSDYFVSTNGFILLFIFNVFIDDLLGKLAKLNVDCYVGHFFVQSHSIYVLMVCCLQCPRSKRCSSCSTTVLFSLMNTMFYSIQVNFIALVFKSLNYQFVNFQLAYKELSFHGRTLYYI